MDVLITTKTQTIAGPTVSINCPLCKAASVPAESFEQIERLELFFVIPLFRLRNTFVRCTACGRQLIATVTTEEIANYSAEALSHYLVGRVSLVGKFLALASVVLCWVPIVGLVLGIVGILVNLRTVGWPRTLSWIGTGLSALLTMAAFVMMAME